MTLPVEIGDGDDQIPLVVAERLVAIGGNSPAEYQIVGEIESDSGGGNGSAQDTTTSTDGATTPTGAEAIDSPQSPNDPSADDGGDDPEGDESEIPTPSTRTRSKRRS